MQNIFNFKVLDHDQFAKLSVRKASHLSGFRTIPLNIKRCVSCVLLCAVCD